MSKRLALFLASSSLLSLAACTALLGSYEVGASVVTPDGGGGGADASDDALVTPDGGGDAATDGGDAGPPPALLKCALNASNARTLDTGPISQTLAAFSINSNQTRVVSQKVGQNVTLYTYDRNGGGSPTITPLPSVGQILSIRKLANGIGILSIDHAAPPATGTSIGVWLIDDATGTATRTTFRLVSPTSSASQQTGGFALLGTDYLFAYGDGNGTISAARYVVGTPSTTFVTIASGVTGGAGNVRSVEVANGKMYVFNDVGPDASNNNASSGYYSIDTALTTPGPLTSLGSGTVGKASFGIATDVFQGNLQAAVVELDLANGTPPAVLHAGNVPAAKAATFNVLDLPAASMFDTLLDAPFGDHASSRFQANDYIVLGPNPNKDPGLDFVWYDTKTKVLRAFNGNANKLLPNRTVSAVAAIGTQTTNIFASFDVVWIENATQNPAATNGMLFSAQMNCIK